MSYLADRPSYACESGWHRNCRRYKSCPCSCHLPDRVKPHFRLHYRVICESPYLAQWCATWTTIARGREVECRTLWWGSPRQFIGVLPR